MNLLEAKMSIIETIMHKIFVFEKEPQMVGLSQFKTQHVHQEKPVPSLKQKDIKLSDLMRRCD